VAGASLAGGAGASSFNLFTTIKILLMKKTTLAILSAAIVAAVSVPLIVAKAGTDGAAVTADSLARGLILHFTFDKDETSSRVTDSSGMGNNGRASGVHWTPTGKKGGAYEFTADGDEIVVPDNVSLNPAQLTLSAWIKTSFTDDKWRRIFDKSYSKGFALSVAADYQGNHWAGLASLEIGPGTHLSISKVKVADGQWHQVVATCDGVEQVLYVDGKAQGRPLRWAPQARPGITTFNLVIGCNRSNLTEDDLGASFRGLIDEPTVWNRALTPAEVAFLFQSQQ
jgi:hypothetical protein